MKWLWAFALLPYVRAQFGCNTQVSKAYTDCANALAPDNWYQSPQIISSKASHLAICYGDYPQCNDLQRLALTSDGYCDIVIRAGSRVTVSSVITPCENPLPPRVQDIQLCTTNNFILSEFYGKLYTDVVRNNDNEHFEYNWTSKTIRAKSNGQCLQVSTDGTVSGLGDVVTAPCDLNQDFQRWEIQSRSVTSFHGFFHLRTQDALKHGSLVSVGFASSTIDMLNHYFAICGTFKNNYVRIVSTRGKRISEYYTGLYFNDPANNFNELFTWDAANKMFKSVSTDQCLDSFLDSDGKYKIHTYNCDVNNGNQKWIVHTDTKQIEHATHTGQCLDGDPTYLDHHLQMWECTPNNPNQQWDVVAYTP